MATNEKLRRLEEKFNMSQELVNEMSQDILVVEPDDLTSLEMTETKKPGEHLPEVQLEEIFSLDLLRQDFIQMRSNVMSIISRGKTILDDAGTLDLGDMKASQLEALSSLQRSVGENIRLMVDIYKNIVAIEKEKHVMIRGLNQENLGVGTSQGAINVCEGGNVTQNVIIAGGTHDILRLMKKAQEERQKE